MRVFLDDLTKDGVPISTVHSNHHLVWNTYEGFSVLDWCSGTHTHKPTLKVGWVLDLGLHNAIWEGPFVENFAQTSMFDFPVGFSFDFFLFLCNGRCTFWLSIGWAALSYLVWGCRSWLLIVKWWSSGLFCGDLSYLLQLHYCLTWTVFGKSLDHIKCSFKFKLSIQNKFFIYLKMAPIFP